MVKKDSVMIGVFSLLFLLSASMILVENFSNNQVTGYATTGTTVSNVTISKYLSVSMSENLSEGILFGTVNSLPANNQNSTHNHDGASSGSTMFLNVSSDSNTPVDFCIKANDDLTDSEGGNILAIANESYHFSLTTDVSNPDLSSEVSLTTDYVKAGQDVAVGDSMYYRFWLDIPAATASGTYNNTINFKGVQNGTACGA